MARVKIKRKIYGRRNGVAFPNPGEFYDGPDEICKRLVTFGFAELDTEADEREAAAEKAARAAEVAEAEAAQAAEDEAREKAEAEEAEREAAAEEAATEAQNRERATAPPVEKRGPGRPRKNQ